MKKEYSYKELLNHLYPRLCAGDEVAKNRVALDFFDYFLSIAIRDFHWKWKRDGNDVKAAVDDSFLKFFERCESGLGNDRNLMGLIYTILRNKLRGIRFPEEKQFYQSSDDESSFDLEDIDNSEEDMITTEKDREKIREAIENAGLSENEREVIFLHYFKRMSTADILEMLKKGKLNTIQAQLRSARKKIKEYLHRKSQSDEFS